MGGRGRAGGKREQQPAWDVPRRGVIDQAALAHFSDITRLPATTADTGRHIGRSADRELL